MQALSMAHHIGQTDKPVPVFRLVTKGTLEERVHQLADKKKGSDLVFKSSIRYLCLLCSSKLHAVYPPIHAFGACCLALAPVASHEVHACEQQGCVPSLTSPVCMCQIQR